MSFNGNLQPSSDEGTDLTTKGDIHGFSTENVRVPVGTNGHVLTARSTNSNGIAWETSAGGAETHEFTTAETWNPTTQTGIMEVLVDVRNMTAGSMTVTIDGSLKETLTTSSTTSRGSLFSAPARCHAWKSSPQQPERCRHQSSPRRGPSQRRHG